MCAFQDVFYVQIATFRILVVRTPSFPLVYLSYSISCYISYPLRCETIFIIQINVNVVHKLSVSDHLHAKLFNLILISHSSAFHTQTHT